MAAGLETGRQKVVSINKPEKCSNQLHIKVNQMEEQLHKKDKEILDLKKINDGLSCRLLDTTNDL